MTHNPTESEIREIYINRYCGLFMRDAKQPGRDTEQPIYMCNIPAEKDTFVRG